MYACSSPGLPRRSLRSNNNLLDLPTSLLHDRYRILKSLGQGGFGRTFLAVDESQPPLQCVVKQLLPDYSIHRQKSLTLFHQEAQRLAELGEHPQIPKLLDTFEQDGEPFIVQEWIDGWTLEQEAEGVLFDEVEVRQVLQELLPVLQYLHDRQIVHRDIKPANIIRRQSDRQLVLVDFGAAKQLINIRPIHTGTMIGSVEYAAPEQIKGQAVFASDLYSLGVTCLYLLTQMSPFDLYDIVEDDWKWQAYLPQPISSDLKTILCKLLQPAVRRRYQSAAEVLTDLYASSESAIARQVEDAIPYVVPTRSFASGIASPRTDATLYLNAPSIKSLPSETVPSELNLIASSVQATRSISGATIYLPQTQDWYYLPQMTSCNPGTSTSLIKKLRVYCSNLLSTETKDAIELVFSITLLFMLTCVGSMLMICLFMKMEKTPSPPTEAQRSALPSPNTPIK